uniref:Uncharacterized protein n=1 Tax=Heterorhabditis bacteriophora TaxID=37862 RepID=A0A1I7X7I0_HETBA
MKENKISEECDMWVAMMPIRSAEYRYVTYVSPCNQELAHSKIVTVLLNGSCKALYGTRIQVRLNLITETKYQYYFTKYMKLESVLESAKALLRFSKDKSWQQLVKEQVESIGKPYCERLSAKEIDKSPMSYRDIYRVNRSRSVDLSFLSREKYLSRWSRENTPTDCLERYTRNIRRSYTPVREVSGIEMPTNNRITSDFSPNSSIVQLLQRVEDTRHPLTSHRSRTPLAMVTTPYHTNIHYRSEEQPFRKYDVFGLRTWSYPIYNYLSTFLSTSNSFKGRSSSPWYCSYYGNSGLRHFNSYRPNIYTPKTAIWTRYY